MPERPRHAAKEQAGGGSVRLSGHWEASFVFGQFLNAKEMATSFKRGGEPEIDKAFGCFERNHAGSKRKDIGIVMLAGKSCRVIAPGNRTAYPLHLIGGNRLAVAGATDHDAFLGLPRGHFFGGRDAPERIISGFRGVGAAINDLIPLGAEHFCKGFLVGISGVIAAKGDFHSRFIERLPPPCQHGRRKKSESPFDRVDLDRLHLDTKILEPRNGALDFTPFAIEF